MISETDKAYLAGLVDGEGAIYVVAFKAKRVNGTSASNHRAEISVSNTNPVPIVWAHGLWGGYLKDRDARNPGFRRIYQLIWRRDKALTVIADILPYLQIKRPQAKLCRALILYTREHPMPSCRGAEANSIKADIYARRERMSKAMRNLNTKGNHYLSPTIHRFAWQKAQQPARGYNGRNGKRGSREVQA